MVPMFFGPKNRNLNRVPRSSAAHGIRHRSGEPTRYSRAAAPAAGRGSGRSSYSTSIPILDLPLVVVVEAALRVDMRRPPPDRRPPEPGLAAGGGGRLRISLASR
jgi:hypothetical protein